MSLNVDETSTAMIVAGTYPVLAVAYYSAARAQLDDVFDRSGPDRAVTVAVPPWAQRPPFASITRFVVNVRPPEGSPDVIDKVVIDERLLLATDRIFNLMFPLGFLLSIVAVAFEVRWALALAVVGVAWVAAVVLLYATQTSMIRFALRAAGDGGGKRVLSAPRRRGFFSNPESNVARVEDIPFNYLARAQLTATLMVVAAVILAVLIEIAD